MKIVFCRDETKIKNTAFRQVSKCYVWCKPNTGHILTPSLQKKCGDVLFLTLLQSHIKKKGAGVERNSKKASKIPKTQGPHLNLLKNLWHCVKGLNINAGSIFQVYIYIFF